MCRHLMRMAWISFVRTCYPCILLFDQYNWIGVIFNTRWGPSLASSMNKCSGLWIQNFFFIFQRKPGTAIQIQNTLFGILNTLFRIPNTYFKFYILHLNGSFRLLYITQKLFMGQGVIYLNKVGLLIPNPDKNFSTFYTIYGWAIETLILFINYNFLKIFARYKNLLNMKYLKLSWDYLV